MINAKNENTIVFSGKLDRIIQHLQEPHSVHHDRWISRVQVFQNQYETALFLIKQRIAQAVV